MRGRILVVDDDVDQASLFHEILLAAGISVIVSSDGHAALDLLSRHQIDVMLLDYVLPGIDGLEVCRLVRQIGHRHPRIIVMSGISADASRCQALAMGANDYLQKPIEAASLLDCVARHLAEAVVLREA